MVSAQNIWKPLVFRSEVDDLLGAFSWLRKIS